MAEEIRGRDLAGVQVHESTFNGASFRDSDLRGVADCVDTVLREHTEHRRFAERDLAALAEGA